MSFLPQTLVDWAQIFSAIGTCGAVMVSLQLARRNERPRLAINSFRNIHIGGEAGFSVSLVAEFTNVGTMPVTISNIFHTASGSFHNVRCFSDGSEIPLASFPLRLRPGDHIELRAPLDDPGWSRINGPWSVWRQTWDVYSSLGTTQRFRVDIWTAKRLWKDMSAIRGGARAVEKRLKEISDQ